MKISKIRVIGHFDTRRVTPWDYNETLLEFATDEENPINLPEWNELKRIGDPDELWILLHDLTIRIYLKNGTFFEFKFKRGWIYDKTSTPVGRNNRLSAMIATICHDADFSNHHLRFMQEHGDEGFRATNDLFYKTLRCKTIIGSTKGYKIKRMNWFLARWYYRGVRSIFGQALYVKNDRAFWHERTVEFTRGHWN